MSHRPVTFHRDPAANSAATNRPAVGGGVAPSPGTTTFRVTGGGAPRVGGVGIRVGAMSSASTASPITQAVPARSPVIGVRSGSSTGIPVKPAIDPRPVVPSARRDSDSDSSPPSGRPVAVTTAASAPQMPQLHLQQPSRVCVAPASDVRGSVIVSPNSSRMLADSSRLSSMSAYGASSAAGAGVTVAARRADSPQPSQPQSMGASMTDSARGPVTGANSVRFIPQQQPVEEPRNRSASPAKSGFHTAAPMAAPSAIQLQLAATAGAHITAAPLYYEAQSAGARNATSITRFKVFARVRPFIDTEIEASVAAGAKSTADLRSVIEMVGQRTILLDPKEDYAPKNQFDFDDSLWSIPAEYKLKRVFADTDRKPFASQKAVYDMVAKGCAEDAFEGVSSAIMSYGQTGSGKTYTMMGNYNPYEVANGDGPEGIIPRVCHDVFREVERKRRAEAATKADPALRHTFTLEVTFVEVYMEKVRDLLDPSLRHARPGEGKFTEARIRQHPETGPFVEDVTKYKVESWQQCCALLERGQMQRRTMATTVHQQSSRSHAIFTITVVEEQKIPPKDKYSAPGCKRRIGRINLVDLAGSERGGFQEYVRESANINTSLLALRRVIDNLVERQNCMLERMRIELEGPAILAAGGVLPPPPPPPPQVPFRDSVLTWLLSDSFGGNARTTMIAALSPHARNFGDTLATLTWSSRARKLVTVVKANDVQQTVAKGYNTKLQEMEMRLQLQRQTVDSIRGDLAQKQAMIDDLDKKRIAVENETRRSEANAAHEYEVRNALVIQRAWREYRHGDRVRGLRDQYQALRARVAEAEAANAARRTEVNAALERTRAAESGDAGIRAELDAATADLGRYERERDAFDKLFAERMAQKRAGEEELETLKARYAEDEATLKSAVDAAHVILTQARARNDSNRAAISRNRATVERLGPQEVQERMRHEGDELTRANDDYEETMVEPLRRRKAELLAQIEKVQAEIDKKRGGRRSQSPQASASRTDSQSMASRE